MATKKVTKKPAVKKTVAKKGTAKKTAPKKVNTSVLQSNVSIVFAMAVEALILFLGYLIIMNMA